MMRQGLKAQLLRFAGDAEVKQTLGRALATLDAQARATAKLQASELWSWEVKGGRLVAVPFGASQQHDTESNSLQLWSNTR